MNTIILPKTQHLVVFQEVIKSGSIGSAARQLGLTQPAVSKIISDIESYFGVEVMVRKNTGVGALPRWLLWLAWIGLVYLSAFTLLFLFSQTGLLG